MCNEHDRGLLREHPEWLVLSDLGVVEGRTRVAVDEDGTLTGFATHLISNGVAEIEDLFVDPLRMREGIAAALVLDILFTATPTWLRGPGSNGQPTRHCVLRTRRVRAGRDCRYCRLSSCSDEPAHRRTTGDRLCHPSSGQLAVPTRFEPVSTLRGRNGSSRRTAVSPKKCHFCGSIGEISPTGGWNALSHDETPWHGFVG